MTEQERFEHKCVDTIRGLAMDGVQAANSGHPGTPMAMAPVAYELWNYVLRFDPEHLRRWMKVLHTQYRRSGWPMDMWPDWMGEDSEAEANAEPGLLH